MSQACLPLNHDKFCRAIFFFLSSTSLLHCVGSAVAIIPDRTGHNPWNRSAL